MGSILLKNQSWKALASDLDSRSSVDKATGVDKSLALDSASKYLNLYPELQALMTGTTPYTLFAPSNEA